MNKVDWALLYMRRGLNVMPLRGKYVKAVELEAKKEEAKRPLLETWERYQTHRVTEQEVRAWWETWPDADIGIITGPVSGRFVLDVDEEKGQRSLQGKIVPTTQTVKTKRGFHYHFSWNSSLIGLATTKKKIYPGLDIRGEGGYVVAPPSTGVAAPPYVWLRDLTTPLAQIPEWLVKLVKAETYDTDNLGDLNAGATRGNRHDTLVRLVSGFFNQGFTEPEIIPLVEEWNTKNSPPLTTERLANDLKGILHYFRTGKYLTPKQRDYQRITDTAEDTSHVESAAVAVDDYFKHLEAASERKEPEMKFGWKKLDEVAWGIERKELIVVGAGPGVGKTNLLMNVAQNLGEQKKKVLYFSTEMERNKIYNRYFALATGVPHRAIKTGQLDKEQKARLATYKETFRQLGFHTSKAHAPDSHMVRIAAEKYEPDVLIFDYIQHIKISSDNRRLEIVGFMMDLKELAKDLNMAVICASQFNRPMRDLKSGTIRPFTIYDFAESSNIEKEASIAFILQKPAESPDVIIPVQVDLVKNRDDVGPSFQLWFDKRTAKFHEEILDEF